MPQPYDYGALMGNAAQLTNVYPSIQHALLGQQQIEQSRQTTASNQSALDQQSRADVARQAMARIVSTPNLDDQTFEQLLQPIAQAEPNTAVSLRRNRQMQAAIPALLSNPTPRAIMEFNAAYPEGSKQINDAVDGLNAAQQKAVLSTASDVHALLAPAFAPNATPEQKQAAITSAHRVIQAHMDADKAAGLDVSQYDALLQSVQDNPAAASVMAGSIVAKIAGPEKYGETFAKLNEADRANDLHPAAVREGVAKASTAETTAQFAPQVAQSDLQTASAQRVRMSDQTANEQAQISLDRDKLSLDKDKLSSEIQLKLEEMDRNGVKPDAGSLGIMNTAVGNAASAQALADRMDGLASRMVGQKMGTGWGAWLSTNAKDAFGTQDAVSSIRNEYQQLVNSQAVKNLPPGPASDKDIAMVKQGFPPANASPQFIHDWLRGMAKLQRVVADGEGRKSDWIAANGNLGPAKSDLHVGGVMIPRGTSYVEFNGSAIKRAKQGAMPETLTSIVNKYGGR